MKVAFEEVIKLEPTIKSVPGLAQGFVDNAPLDKLPKRLLDFLIIKNLYKRYPKIFGVLCLMGVIGEEHLDNIDPFQPECKLKIIYWEKLPRYLYEPGKVFDEDIRME